LQLSLANLVLIFLPQKFGWGLVFLAQDCSSIVCTFSLAGYTQTFSATLEHCAFQNAFGADPYIEFATYGNAGSWSYKETCTGGVCSLTITIFPMPLPLYLVFSLTINGNLATGSMALTSLNIPLISANFILLLDPCPFYATVYFAYGALGVVIVITIAFCCYRRQKNAQVTLAYLPLNAQSVPTYTLPSGPLPALTPTPAVPQLPLNQFEAAIVQFYTERHLWDKISKAPMIAKEYLHKQTEFWNQVYAKYPLQKQGAPTYTTVASGSPPTQVSPTSTLPLNQFEAAIVQFYTERHLWDKISKAPMIAREYLHKQTEFWNQVYAKYPLQQQPVPASEQKDDSDSSDSDSEEETSKTPLLNEKPVKQKKHKKKSRKKKTKCSSKFYWRCSTNSISI